MVSHTFSGLDMYSTDPAQHIIATDVGSRLSVCSYDLDRDPARRVSSCVYALETWPVWMIVGLQRL